MRFPSFKTPLLILLPAVAATTGFVAAPQAAQAAGCSITVGAGGGSTTYTASVASVPAVDFIRQTSGNCRFTVFNRVNFDTAGRFVTLGKDLSGRIRAGIDGIENKDSGGGDTWRIRSIRVTAAPTDCSLRIGGNGIRMTYLGANLSTYNVVPAMNRATSLTSAPAVTCHVDVFNHTSLQTPFRGFNEFSAEPAIDIGFRARSMRFFRSP